MRKNILPMIAAIGIGTTAYCVMTGKANNLQKFLPQITNMMGKQGT